MGQSLTKGAPRRLLYLCFYISLCLTAYTTTYAKQGASMKQRDWNDQGKQKVTLVVDNTPLKSIFKLLQSQTGLGFFYSTEDFDLNKKFTLSMVNRSLDEVLAKLLTANGLTFKYRDNVIVIKLQSKHKSAAASSADSTINSITLTGKITDAAGNPIPGATVRVKRTSDGATTDEDGNFTLPNTRPSEKIIISSIGYETREITVDGKSLMVKLNVVVNDLDETVIKGYYSTTRRLNTGNVSTVKAADISKQPVGDPLAALQGRVPGLYIRQSSGVPGTAFTVRLRGQNSLRSEANNPLFIIDGIPFTSTSLISPSYGEGAGAISPLNSINVSDIESIEVLKDADATSIYGSRGANGVILITTKKGKAGTASVNINIYTGIGKVTRTLDWMNTEQYLDMRHEAFQNDGLQIGLTDYDLNGKWDTTRYTNWEKVFIGGTSKITDAQIGLSGGGNLTQFTVGAGYRNETTVFPGDYSDRKFSVHSGFTHSSTDKKLQLSFSGTYVNDNNQMPTADLTSYIALAPNAPSLFDESGNLNWQDNTWTNPFAILQQRAKAITDNLLGSLVVSYHILPGLTVKSSFGYNKIEMKQNRIFPLTSYSPEFQGQSIMRQNHMGNNTQKSWILEPRLEYEKTIGDGKLETIIGTTLQENTQEALSQTAANFSNDALIENIKAAGIIVTNNYTNTLYRYASAYGRLGYVWRNRYVLNFTARRDGSSRFGTGKRYGNFGSLGAAWIFSEENYIRNNIPFLSFGKIRASIGTTGNDQIADYQYLSTFSAINYNYQDIPGLVPTRLTNPDYRWEQIKKIEAALEIGLIQDKIHFVGNWYRNRTSNQLVNYALPSTAGFTSIQYNLPAIVQNTGIELELTTSNINSKTLTWSSNFNISFPRNKLIAYPNIEGSPYSTTYTVGQSLFVTNLFHYYSIDPNSGLYTFQDKNNDGKYTFADDRSFVFRGQDFFGGFENSFTVKQWEISFMLQFVKQKGLSYFYNTLPGNFLNGLGNQPTLALERWQNKGDENALLQKYTTIYTNEQSLFEVSDAKIDDASYVRLENVSIAWQAPKNWLKTIHLQKLRIYLQGQNLLTFTGYKGIDPEYGGALYLPPIRMLTAGIQIGL